MLLFQDRTRVGIATRRHTFLFASLKRDEISQPINTDMIISRWKVILKLTSIDLITFICPVNKYKDKKVLCEQQIKHRILEDRIFNFDSHKKLSEIFYMSGNKNRV